MVHVFHAMLTATLALNAAAPILAAPLFSSPDGHGRLVGRPAPLEPPVLEPPPSVAEPEPALAPAPVAKESSELKKALYASAVGGLATATALNLLGKLRRGHAIDDEVYLAAREPPVEPPVSKKAPAANEKKRRALSGPILSAVIGGGASAAAIAFFNRLLPHRREPELADLISTNHRRDLDADALRLLLGRDLEDLFARSFGVDELD